MMRRLSHGGSIHAAADMMRGFSSPLLPCSCTQLMTVIEEEPPQRCIVVVVVIYLSHTVTQLSTTNDQHLNIMLT